MTRNDNERKKYDTKRSLKRQTDKIQIDVEEHSNEKIYEFEKAIEFERAIEETYKVVDNKIDVIVQKVNVMAAQDILFTIKHEKEVASLYSELMPHPKFQHYSFSSDWYDLTHKIDTAMKPILEQSGEKYEPFNWLCLCDDCRRSRVTLK